MRTPAILSGVRALRERLATSRAAGAIALVPTMGALHTGHARLIERARLDCATVVVSIFVNPLQFDRQNDLLKYPRTLPADVALCARHGVDFVFAPEAAELYAQPPACTIDVGHLADRLCGRFRPGHFKGVATVVMKLLQIVQPDRAYFGEKDAQQLAIVRRLASDFNVPVAIEGVPTAREPDGLAMSSRNVHLTAEQRARAPALYRVLSMAGRLANSGMTDVEAIKTSALAELPAGDDIRLEYLEIVDPADLQPVTAISGSVLIAGAMWIGSTRLIDNVMWTPAKRGATER